jgi:hypothetical protein
VCVSLSYAANELKDSKDSDKKTEPGKDSGPDPDALARVRPYNCTQKPYEFIGFCLSKDLFGNTVKINTVKINM